MRPECRRATRFIGVARR